jgi:hypothetical protein
MKRIGLLCLLILGVGCRSPDSVPEDGALLVHLTCATSLASPTQLRAWVYDDHGVLWDGTSLGSGKLTCPDLGTVLVKPGSFAGKLRLHIAAFAGSSPILDKALAVTGLAGSRNVDMVLGVPLERDDDEDNVPNVIDDCPSVPNPEQHGCPDGGTAASDASPLPDAILPSDRAGFDVGAASDAVPVSDAMPVADTASVQDVLSVDSRGGEIRDATTDPVNPTPDTAVGPTADAAADAPLDLGGDGTACRHNNECASGNCVSNVCCESKCTTPLYSCTVPGFEGRCIQGGPGGNESTSGRR